MGDYKFDDNEFNKLYDEHFYQAQYYDYLTQNQSPSSNGLNQNGHPQPISHSHSNSNDLGINDDYTNQLLFPNQYYSPQQFVNLLEDPQLVDTPNKRRNEDDYVPQARPAKPIRQNSNPTMRRKGRPSLNKSYSYSTGSPLGPSPGVSSMSQAGLSGSPSMSGPGKSGAPSLSGGPGASARPGPTSVPLSNQTPIQQTQFTSPLQNVKRKPDFHLNLDHLKNTSTSSLDSFTRATPSNKNLAITDHDLNLDKELDNITPGMKPPGTNEDDYFEDFLVPLSFDVQGNNSEFIPLTFDLYDKDEYLKFDDINDFNDFNEFIPQNNQFLRSGTQSQDESSPQQKKINKSPLSHSSASPDSKSPPLLRTGSNQSISSMNSLNSNKDKSSNLTPGTLAADAINANKKKKFPKGSTCSVCGKFISRDLSRHMRIHDEYGRFRCVYANQCNHRTGKFNRPYDYKKHLLHFHFDFDEKIGKAATNLTEKLPLMGNCKACNFRGKAVDWINHHILTTDDSAKCPFIVVDPNPYPTVNNHDKLD